MSSDRSFQNVFRPNKYETSHAAGVSSIILRINNSFCVVGMTMEIFQMQKFTCPKAIDNMVCIFVDRVPSTVFVMIAFLPTNVFPATDQNFKCLTPAETN